MLIKRIVNSNGFDEIILPRAIEIPEDSGKDLEFLIHNAIVKEWEKDFNLLNRSEEHKTSSLKALGILKDSYHTPRDIELFYIIEKDLLLLRRLIENENN